MTRPIARKPFADMPRSLLAWLRGRSLSTPWPRLRSISPEESEQRVVLVLTHAVVHAKQRREFDRQNRRVLASMGRHSGLLGYAARRQILGNQAWTMSVWADDEDRAAFARSRAHREAIARSMPALRSVALKRLTVMRKDLPADWDQVLRKLAETQARRNHGE